jgi:hypothetical protein
MSRAELVGVATMVAQSLRLLPLERVTRAVLDTYADALEIAVERLSLGHEDLAEVRAVIEQWQDRHHNGEDT